MQLKIKRQKRRHKVDKAKCLAVIDFVFIFPKTTAPACTINCKVETLYDRNIYESLIAIYSEIYG